jgi:hypothetical protein
MLEKPCHYFIVAKFNLYFTKFEFHGYHFTLLNELLILFFFHVFSSGSFKLS